MLAELRRLKLVQMLHEVDFTHGWRQRLADELKISRWTLRNDLAAIREGCRAGHIEKIVADFDRRLRFAKLLLESIDPNTTRQELIQERRQQRQRERVLNP